MLKLKDKDQAWLKPVRNLLKKGLSAAAIRKELQISSHRVSNLVHYLKEVMQKAGKGYHN